MDRSDIPVLAGVAFFCATLVGLLIWSVVMLVRTELHRLRVRRMHNDQDPNCRHWWGDRRRMDMNAQCNICAPTRRRTK